MTPELATRLAGRRVVASVSGGKDSAALSLWLKEQEIEHERIFLDTGWEHPATYEYLRGELTRVIGPIITLRSEGFEALVRRKKMFPSGRYQFCSNELKLKPLASWLATLDEDVVNAVGIRGAESRDRAAMQTWEWSEGLDCETWRPLLSWTMDDVVAIHFRHRLRPNPLYLRGAPRIGCWPCVRSNKEQLATLDDPTIARVAALEGEMGGPTMFAVRPPGSKTRKSLPIAEAVRWARRHRTADLFVDEAPGCMRWGLCETR